jgi:beta-N-acetylhexosaminidase
MTGFKRIFLGLIAVLLLSSAVTASAVTPSMFNKVDRKAMDTWVNSTFASLTPDERISQLIIMAVLPGYNDANKALIKQYVEEGKIGGIIYNEGNIMDEVRMTNYAQSLASVPLMVTVDGEWGLSMRFHNTPVFPRNLLLGSIDDDRLFYEYGREIARECKRVGIQVNFAPVLDVNDNPNNPVIGTRSFGECPEVVARHAIAFSKGMEDGGVLSVAKHFPGHGSTEVDSHKELPTVKKNMHELFTCELLPFREYINAGLSGILTGHLYVPAIDKRRIPATMSSKYVKDLLKTQMGFDGLVFTDALVMKGANVEGSPCVNALMAGNDVLLMPESVKPEIEAIKAAIASGKLSQKDIDERCKKILRYKYALGLSKKPYVSENNVINDVNAPEATVINRRMCAASMTVVKDNGWLLPVRNLQSRHIAVVTLGNDKGLRSMFQRRCADYAATTAFDYKQGDSYSKLANGLSAGQYDVIIVAVCSDDAIYRNVVGRLSDTFNNIALVLFNKPYVARYYGNIMVKDNVKATLLAYDDNTVSEDYAAQTIFGGNSADGILPVSIKVPRKNQRDKLFRAGYGIHYKASRLGYSIPADVGFDDMMLHKIDSIAYYGVKAHAYPGCQVVVARHGKIVCNRSYGDIDFTSGTPVDENTLYDLASVTKATATLSGIMKLYDDGKIQLSEKASEVIPGLRGTDKEDITFRDLLYHETGMPPSLNMFTMMFDPSTYTGTLLTSTQSKANPIKVMDGAYGNATAKLRTDILSPVKTDKLDIAIADNLYGGRVTYDSIMNRIYHVPLNSSKAYLYSCLNFCLLANAEQLITHMAHNNFVNNYIFAPLGAYHTLYRPLTRFSKSQIAATEIDTYLRKQHIHGYVHDELAAFSGGVQGNAGLFSSANDLAKLLQMWLNGGTYGGIRFYKPSTVDVFTKQKSPNSRRGLGFDKPDVNNHDNSPTCDEATPETYGHTGFTGTCYWVDPKNDMFYIFLSNRVCPTRDNDAFSRVSARSHIFSIVYKSIKK